MEFLSVVVSYFPHLDVSLLLVVILSIRYAQHLQCIAICLQGWFYVHHLLFLVFLLSDDVIHSVKQCTHH